MVCPSPSYVFATFVMTVVAQEDQSRVVWPSSPAAGWVTGVNTLWQTPNGKAGLTTHGGGHIWNQGIECKLCMRVCACTCARVRLCVFVCARARACLRVCVCMRARAWPFVGCRAFTGHLNRV